jgi:hypothetical protein
VADRSLRRMQAIRRKGFLVWTESGMKEVGLSEKRQFGRSAISISSAKNEYESFQVVVAPYRANDSLRNVELEFTDLVSKRFVIGKEKITCYVIGYVQIRGATKPEPLFPYNSFWSIMIRQKIADAQPFWITVYVPPNAKAGSYSGAIKVSTKNAGENHVKLKLRVWNFGLPNTMRLKTHFRFRRSDLRSLHVRVQDSAFEDVLFRYRANAAEHRVSCQSTFTPPYAVNRTGRPRAHYEIFDKEIGMLVGLGMNLFCIHPDDLGERISQKDYFQLLMKLRRHLRRRGWLDITYLHLDGSLPLHLVMDKAKIAKAKLPEIKVVADLSVEHRLSKITELADALILRLDSKRFASEKLLPGAMGEVWIDVACRPKVHGSLCASLHLIDHRRLFWAIWSFGAKGIVHDWALPARGSVEPLLYPMENGPMNSVRWETVRDGIEDYEYLCLLEERIHALSDSVNRMTISRQTKSAYLEGKRLLSSIKAKGGWVDVAQKREQIAKILSFFSSRLD